MASATEAAGASSTSDGDHVRVRLLDGGPAPGHDGQRLAAVAVELDPGYLTYWRSPGEAGLPPDFSFAGSTNLKRATPLYPSPGRYSEGGVEAIGYKDGVVFPVLVTPQDADKPVDLKLAMAFGICERLCLPATAQLERVLDGTGPDAEADRAREALGRVPVAATLGQAGSLGVVGVAGRAGDDALSVTVRTTGPEAPTLFAEAPEPWFVQAGEGLWTKAGTLTYPIKVLAKPADPAPLPLRLTLVGADGAVEVPVTLDAPPPKP